MDERSLNELKQVLEGHTKALNLHTQRMKEYIDYQKKNSLEMSVISDNIVSSTEQMETSSQTNETAANTMLIAACKMRDAAKSNSLRTFR